MNKLLIILLVFGLVLFGCPQLEPVEEPAVQVEAPAEPETEEPMPTEEEVQEEVLPIANNTDVLWLYIGLNCTPATYSKQREDYDVELEVLGFDDDGWCGVSYDYVPHISEESESRYVPSNESMSGVYIIYNVNESKKDHTESNVKNGLQYSFIIIVEKLHEKEETGEGPRGTSYKLEYLTLNVFGCEERPEDVRMSETNTFTLQNKTYGLADVGQVDGADGAIFIDIQTNETFILKVDETKVFEDGDRKLTLMEAVLGDPLCFKWVKVRIGTRMNKS